jgi:hypothetical protein
MICLFGSEPLRTSAHNKVLRLINVLPTRTMFESISCLPPSRGYSLCIPIGSSGRFIKQSILHQIKQYKKGYIIYAYTSMKSIHLNYYFVPSILVSASDAPHWRRLEASALGRRAGASLKRLLQRKPRPFHPLVPIVPHALPVEP